jgi:hypothetical protein
MDAMYAIRKCYTMLANSSPLLFCLPTFVALPFEWTHTQACFLLCRHVPLVSRMFPSPASSSRHHSLMFYLCFNACASLALPCSFLHYSVACVPLFHNQSFYPSSCPSRILCLPRVVLCTSSAQALQNAWTSLMSSLPLLSLLTFACLLHFFTFTLSRPCQTLGPHVVPPGACASHHRK